MFISKMPLFNALQTKMKWHQTRQSVLAENVANAETPGYKRRDIQDVSFRHALGKSMVKDFKMARTHVDHFPSTESRIGDFRAKQLNAFEVTPEGNAVNLEDEMMKVTANQMDYQAVSSVYSKGLKIMRIALGKRV